MALCHPRPPPLTRVRQVFEERLPLDAAPLAQAGRLIERQKLRDVLLSATRVFVGALSAGGYHIVGIEVEVSKNAFGKTLNGSIDCVAARDDGSEAIIDFKYSGRNKYREMISDGKAGTACDLRVQSVARCSDISCGRLSDFSPTLNSLTPSGSPLSPEAPPVRGSRHHRLILCGKSFFPEAINAADGWLTVGEPIPARPLQLSSQWPNGAKIVLDDDLNDGESQTVCRYCDYKRLCGLKETL